MCCGAVGQQANLGSTCNNKLVNLWTFGLLLSCKVSNGVQSLYCSLHKLGQVSQGQVRSVRVRSGQSGSGSGQSGSGQVRSGQLGQVRSVRVRSGQVRSVRVRSGQVRSVRSGQVIWSLVRWSVSGEVECAW